MINPPKSARMTPARKAALEWVRDEQPTELNGFEGAYWHDLMGTGQPTLRMMVALVTLGWIYRVGFHGQQAYRHRLFALTDLGRQRLLQSADWKTYKAHWPSGRAYWTVENREKNEIRIGGNGGVTRYHDHGQAKDEAERLNGNAPDEDMLDRVGVVTA